MKTPAELKASFPASTKFVQSSRKAISEIIQGSDPRLLIILGPCSIHNIEGAIAFAKKVNELQKKYAHEAFFVMRSYFEKPRTEGGWKGFLNDPDLDCSHKIEEGLNLSRKLLIDLSEMEVPVAMEFLDPNYALYLEDLVSWGCIGARTCSSQVHRNLASSLKCPIGFKNSIHGKLEPAVFSIKQAMSPQTFFAPDANFCPSVIHSLGNQNAHLVLRGSDAASNYDEASLAHATHLLNEHSIKSKILIDCGHGNSQKDPKAQLDVLAEVVRIFREGNYPICGVMIESHIEKGAQEVHKCSSPCRSITDPCIDVASVDEALGELFTPIRL